MYNTQNSDLILLESLNGAKNLLYVPNGQYLLSSNSNVTVNEGTLTYNSTTSDTTARTLTTITLDAGTYVMMNRQVKPSASSGSVYADLRLLSGSTNLTTGEPATFTLDTAQTLKVTAMTYSSVISDMSIKPMIITKAAYDAGFRDYQSYSLSNAEITSTVIECVDNGVKNLLKLVGDVVNPNVVRVYWNYADGAVRVTGSSAATSPIYIYLGRFVAPETGEYVLSASGANVATSEIYVYDDGAWNTTTSPIATWTKGTARQIYLRIATGVVVGDITIKPMICLKSIYDIDPTVQSHALSNSILTPALIDAVNNGAKNKCDWASATYLGNENCTYSKTDTSLTASAGSAAKESKVFYSVKDFAIGDYVLRFKISSATISQQAYIYVSTSTEASTAIASVQITTDGTYELPFQWAGGIVYLKFFPNITTTSSSNTFTVSDIMISTKADWNVSRSYVSYRPNYDLVCSAVDTLKTKSSVAGGSSSKTVFEVSMPSYSSTGRGAFLISITSQTRSHIPALYYVVVAEGKFGEAVSLVSNTNVVTAVTHSSDNTKLYFTVISNTWAAPVILPLIDAALNMKFSTRWLDSIPN